VTGRRGLPGRRAAGAGALPAPAGADSATRPRARSAAGSAFFLALVLALAAVFAWREETSLDLGFHVASGRWILEHRAWPRLDPFTYSVPGHEYVDMHGLFQIAAAFAWNAAGTSGIGGLRVALVLATVLLLWATARHRGARGAPAAAVFALGLCAWEMRFVARPELVTYLLLALELYLLRRHTESGEARWLWAVVPVQWVWTWSHALSLFGTAVLGLYALAGAATAAFRRRNPAGAPWAALALAALAMVLNPYGPRGVAFLWDLRTRIQSGNVFADSIGELLSPFSPQAASFPPIVAFLVLLAVTLLAVLVRLRTLRLFDVLLIALFGGLAAGRVRNLGLFVVAALPVAAAAVCDLAGRLPGARRAARPAAALAGAAIVLAGVAVAGGGWYAAALRPMRFGHAESAAVYPLGNLGRIRELGISGPFYNALDHGGYLLLHLWPRETVYADGRLEVLGEEFYRRYLALQRGDGWLEEARRHGWNAAIVPYTSTGLLRAMHADTTWALIAVDGVSALLVRNTPRHRAAIDSSWTVLARLTAVEPVEAGRLRPGPLRPWLARRLVRRPFPFEAWGRGNAFAMLGLFPAARREYARALAEAEGDEPALVKNYALTCHQLGRLDEAADWYRRLLEVEPGNEIARSALARLGG
jgi:hypothetical protein